MNSRRNFHQQGHFLSDFIFIIMIQNFFFFSKLFIYTKIC